jgi:hypothetical protein
MIKNILIFVILFNNTNQAGKKYTMELLGDARQLKGRNFEITGIFLKYR